MAKGTWINIFHFQRASPSWSWLKNVWISRGKIHGFVTNLWLVKFYNWLLIFDVSREKLNSMPVWKTWAQLRGGKNSKWPPRSLRQYIFYINWPNFLYHTTFPGNLGSSNSIFIIFLSLEWTLNENLKKLIYLWKHETAFLQKLCMLGIKH